MEFITGNVLIISLFILIIHCIETLAYSVRLSGARVKLIASALSLFSTMVIFSRMANMMQQPFTGSLVDEAREDQILNYLDEQFRIVIGASTVGTIVGILLMPTFVALFSRAIILLAKERGSILVVIKKAFTIVYLKRSMKHFRLPRLSYLEDVNFKDIPYKLFFINLIVTGIYTIGVLSALYASLLAPERGATAMMSSGLINGVATILLSLLIDPKISVLADDVVNNRGSYSKLKGISIMMVSSRLLGTLFAQLLLIPGANYIAWVTKLIS